jgi:hypothetical protein
VPLLFQFARYEDNLSEAAMRRYFDAASEPKSILWYETGHDLNDPRALGGRARWLSRHLRIRDIGLVLHRSLGE